MKRLLVLAALALLMASVPALAFMVLPPVQSLSACTPGQLDFSVACNAIFDRVAHAPRGREGGRDGAPGAVRLRNGGTLRTKGYQVIPAGDRLILELPGGGGMGPEAERDADRSARDIRDDLVTVS